MNQALVPSSKWIEPTLSVADGDQVMTFTIQDAFNYHGYDAAGGVVLGFRLLQKAAELLADKDTLLQRHELSLFTAFPGLGARDCFELITRMATENRYTVDTSFNDTIAQIAISGRFYFRFGYQGKQVALAPIEGQPTQEFIRIGTASKQPNASDEIQKQWQQVKYQLADTLLTNHYRDVIRVV